METVKSKITDTVIIQTLEMGKNITTNPNSSGDDLRTVAHALAGIICELSLRIVNLMENAKEAEPESEDGNE